MKNDASEVNPYEAPLTQKTDRAPNTNSKDSVLGVRIYLWLHALAVGMTVVWALYDTRAIDWPILDFASAFALPGMVFILMSPFACLVFLIQAVLGNPQRMMSLLAEMFLGVTHALAALPLVQ